MGQAFIVRFMIMNLSCVRHNVCPIMGLTRRLRILKADSIVPETRQLSLAAEFMKHCRLLRVEISDQPHSCSSERIARPFQNSHLVNAGPKLNDDRTVIALPSTPRFQSLNLDDVPRRPRDAEHGMTQ